MRTAIATHELLPKGLRLETLSIGTGHVRICVESMASGSRCPLCGRGSSRTHSHYSRTVSDLPWHGISVALEVRARRLFCDEASCERRIFCERARVAARARKTSRLEEALLAIVLELGGRAGARSKRTVGPSGRSRARAYKKLPVRKILRGPLWLLTLYNVDNILVAGER